jgi:ribonuclease HI
MRYYAVTCGRELGIYDDVDDAVAQVRYFSGGFCKSFARYQDAKLYLLGRVGSDWYDCMTGFWNSEVYLEVFTDGSCLGNGLPGARSGFACYFPSTGRIVSGPLPATHRHTNTRAEYFAVLKALEEANRIDPWLTLNLRIFTDCQSLVSCLEYQSAGKRVKNQDLLQAINALRRKRFVEIFHVIAHSGNSTYVAQGNAKADSYAKQAAKQACVRASANIKFLNYCKYCVQYTF